LLEIEANLAFILERITMRCSLCRLHLVLFRIYQTIRKVSLEVLKRIRCKRSTRAIGLFIRTISQIFQFAKGNAISLPQER
jgi:hypothetical protein